MCRRRRVCLRQQTTATRWRRQLSAGLLWPANARCNGATALGNKIERPIWPRALVPAAPAIHPRAFGNLHLSPSAANSDIPIK